MFLRQEVPNPRFREICAEARAAIDVEDPYPFLDGIDDAVFRFHEYGFKLFVPFKGDFGAQESAKWLKHISQLGIVGHLVNKAKPTTDVSGTLRRRELEDCIYILRKGFDTAV